MTVLHHTVRHRQTVEVSSRGEDELFPGVARHGDSQQIT